MGTNHDSGFWLLAISFWGLAGDDIGAFEDGTVVAFEVGFLQFHLIAVLFELLLNPLGTLLVGLAVHDTRTKVALGSTEGVS